MYLLEEELLFLTKKWKTVFETISHKKKQCGSPQKIMGCVLFHSPEFWRDAYNLPQVLAGDFEARSEINLGFLSYYDR